MLNNIFFLFLFFCAFITSITFFFQWNVEQIWVNIGIFAGEHPEAMHSRCTSIVQQQNLYVKNSLLIVLLLMLISHTAKRINL